jgi:hypothetical protein
VNLPFADFTATENQHYFTSAHRKSDSSIRMPCKRKRESDLEESEIPFKRRRTTEPSHWMKTTEKVSTSEQR